MRAYKGKVALITGASSGIGRRLAERLADAGAKLVLCARSTGKLNEAVEECERRGAQAIAFPTDVRREDECRAAVDAAITEYGGLDILINNAGVSMYSFFSDLDDLNPVRQTMEINYFGSVYCTYYALPHLRKSKGRIVAINSLTGLTGVPTRTGYAASKHAMTGFFDSLRIEMADSGVSVTSIFPGFVETQVRESALGSDGKALGRETYRGPKAMDVDVCAGIILRAVARRRRQVVMTAKGKIGIWLKLLAPGLVDTIARRTILKSQE